MAVYALSPIFNPQFIANAAAQLIMATPGAPVAVPASFNYQIAVARVANVGSIPVSLKVWRVPVTKSNDDEHIVLPEINIPVATNTFPYFDLTTLWGITLQVGDSIYAQAGAASALTIHCDGAVIQI